MGVAEVRSSRDVIAALQPKLGARPGCRKTRHPVGASRSEAILGSEALELGYEGRT